jgi:hypothetical protein
MRKRRFLIQLCCIPVMFNLVLATPVFGESQKVPDAVKALVGTYTGSWVMYGINPEGGVVEKMKWTDVIEAKKPEIKDGRAFVSTVDRMQFEGGIPPQQMTGTEGYFLNKDGSLGDYYFENYGQVFKMIRLGEKTWVYAMPANPGRLAFLGFQNVISGRHVMVKEVTEEDGIEFHRISRVTTVNWKDQTGQSRWMQYISLKGFHKRSLQK